MPRRLLGEGAVTVMSRALGSGDLAWGPRAYYSPSAFG